MSTLAAACRAKLVNMLPLLGSDKQGEGDAAALAAHRIMTKAGVSWDNILPTAPPPHREPLIGTWRKTCAQLHNTKAVSALGSASSSLICPTSSGYRRSNETASVKSRNAC